MRHKVTLFRLEDEIFCVTQTGRQKYYITYTRRLKNQLLQTNSNKRYRFKLVDKKLHYAD